MARSKSPRPVTSGQPSQLRIIGGRWRSRKLTFLPTDGLRPTTDRIRETVFNWLGPHLSGARCADLFAGSGALGLEALSRGAIHCDFIDTSASAVSQITHNLTLLDAGNSALCHHCDAAQFLSAQTAPLDIVFIDPPFGRELIVPACELLTARRLLSPDAMVYIEAGKDEPLGPLPTDWDLHREKVAGGVAYRLFIARQG